MISLLLLYKIMGIYNNINNVIGPTSLADAYN